MKSAIIYSSLTGNTKMIAKAINSVIKADIFERTCAPKDLSSYDLIILGFWADKGGADSKTAAYFQSIKNKKIAFFFTLGAEANSDYADKLVQNTLDILASNEILAYFKCQGKIDPKILELSTKVGEMTEERRQKIEECQKHPDENDIKNAKDFAKAILQEFSLRKKV